MVKEKEKIFYSCYVMSWKWSLIKPRTEKLHTIISKVLHNTFLQNHRMVGVERDLQRSSCPPLPAQAGPQRAQLLNICKEKDYNLSVFYYLWFVVGLGLLSGFKEENPPKYKFLLTFCFAAITVVYT